LAAKVYEQELLGALGAPPEIDVAFLGVGLDGHVASLFPGHPLLAEQNRWVAAVTDSPKPPPRRLTLTLGALCAARLVLVAAFGSAKADAVRRLLDTASSEVPLALLARGATRMFVLLDEASRGLLE
jgi:6-phosphogluconolactonase